MGNPNNQNKNKDYNPRWFIWTIVLLVVTGLSLLSYIVISDPSSQYQEMGMHKITKNK